MNKLYYLIAFLFLAAIGIAQDTTRTAKDTLRVLDPGLEFYKIALKQIDSMQYKEAIKTLQKAVKKSPEMTGAFNKMAFCKMQLKNYRGAQKDLHQLLKLNPDNTEAIKYLGRMYFLDKKYIEAKVYYDSAFKVTPEDHELLYYRAELKIAGKDLNGALVDLNECLFQKENYPPALIKRGMIKYEQQAYNYAIKDISDGIKLNKDTTFDKEVYRTRAKAYFENAYFKAAIEDYTKIINRFPNDEDALTYRGGAKININDNSGAIDDLTRAIEINKKSHIAYNFRGAAKGGLKKNSEALKDFDYAIKLKFDYPSAYVNRAAVKMAAKDKKGACKDLEKADQLGSDVAYKLIQQHCTGH